jgi:ABC-type glycerol-3-phosphate transport system substrate-binding protein
MQTALMRPVSADQPLDQALAAALTEALVAVLKDGRPADEALQTAQGHFVQAVAEITKPAPSSRPVIVSTPIPTPAIPVTRIRFDPGVSNSWAIPEVVQQFNRQHEDIEVTVVQPSPRDDSSIEASARRSDCFVQWRPFSFGEPMQTESVRDLQPLIDADASFPHDDYLPGLFEPFKRDGKLLGLPHDLRLLGIGYNKTLFDAVGQEYPRADWTLDDFLRAAERLTTGDGNKRVYGFGEPWGNPGSDFLINQAGASLLIGSGDRVKPNFTDPKVIGALQTYIDLLRNTSPQTRMLNFDPSQQLRKANDLRNQGRIGMWFSADKPRRYIGLDPSVTLAMAPAPMSSYAPTPSDLWLSGFYISAQAPDPEACWTFGLFLNTNVLAITEYGSPTRISVGESSAYAAAELEGVVIWQAHRAALNRPPVPNQQASWINDIELTGRYWLDRASIVRSRARRSIKS